MKVEIDLSKVPVWRRAAIIRELQAVADDSLMMTTLEERLSECLPSANWNDHTELVANLMEATNTYIADAQLSTAILDLMNAHELHISTDFSQQLRTLITDVFKPTSI